MVQDTAKNSNSNLCTSIAHYAYREHVNFISYSTAITTENT